MCAYERAIVTEKNPVIVSIYTIQICCIGLSLSGKKMSEANLNQGLWSCQRKVGELAMKAFLTESRQGSQINCLLSCCYSYLWTGEP